jgi:hypothetical protein
MRAKLLSSGRTAADVIEIDVDSLWASSSELSRKIGCSMVNRSVKVQCVVYVGAFLPSAGDADRSRAFDLGKLANQRTNRSARRSDHDGFAGLGFT